MVRYLEKERQLSLWQRRHHLLKKMKAGLDRIRPPDPPSSVQLEVVGTRSLRVKFTEPTTAHDQDSIVTKYKVEWSCYEDFSPLSGSVEISDVQKLEVTIPDLTQGTAYFVRVCAGNVKGYSSWRSASPLSATPSCWRDVEGKKSRSSGHIGKLDDLFYQVTNARSPYSKEIKDLSDTPQQQRKQVRKSIKHLFTSAPKFHKTMKRGVFLACLLYSDERIAVTAEDILPILEVDENYPTPLHTDFYWLMKIACTWEDVKALRQDMEKSHSSSNVHFRIKLLQAVEQMQSALGLQDLGQLYQHPLKDSEGTTVLCTVKRVSDPKSMVTLSVRWLPLHKLLRKLNNNTGDGLHDPNANDLLLESITDMMTYHRVSGTPLERGLYVGYVKLKSSVDVIRVLVPKHMPNVLPFHKVRDNPHVSCEEWEWFRNMIDGEQLDNATEIQQKFKKAVSAATKTLLSNLNICGAEADTHRFYDAEVIELSKEVSFLLILPPVDSVCSVPGQSEEVASKLECISLPVQIFEMIHMATYQPKFIARYSRLSSILEMDTIVANHAHREAFSTSEIMQAKTRLNLLQDLQGQMDNAWRSVRWIMDVLTFARDKQVTGGIPLKNIWIDKTTPDSPSPTPPTCIVNISNSKPEKPGVLERNLTLTTPSHEAWFPEMRRCSSTSRLHESGSDPMINDENKDTLTADSHPKAHSAERLGVQTTDKDLLEIEHKRDSVRSSFTGSLSSLDIMLDDDKLSVYSKDSACSVGVGEDSISSKKANSLDWSLASSPNGETGSGVIRVYAAYETGLPSGTSVKLHITPLTTAREVVDLVVKQLNMAVVLKGRGGPIYGNTHLPNFCLVSMVGSRERCLGDDFQPMKLQNPWLKGKLYVRRKSCPPFPINGD